MEGKRKGGRIDMDEQDIGDKMRSRARESMLSKFEMGAASSAPTLNPVHPSYSFQSEFILIVHHFDQCDLIGDLWS
jgi:hypothetical protein